MSAPSRFLHAEAIKLKHTLALYMCGIAPGVVVLLSSLLLCLQPATAQAGALPWEAYARNTFALWALLMLPLFVTLESALLAQLEYGNRQWKHLLALPVSRQGHYFAKFAALMALALLAMFALCVLTIGAGLLLDSAGVLPLSGPLPLGWMLRRSLEMGTGTAAILALHQWVAMRWGNFTVAIGFGICVSLVAFLMAQSKVGYLLPWSWAALPVSPTRAHLAWTLLASPLLGLLVLLVGSLDVQRRLGR